MQTHNYQDEEFETLVSPCFERIWSDFESEGKIVVDLGCGKGAYLALLGDNAVGVDVSKPNLEACRARGLSVIEGDINKNLPFNNGSVDVVLASHMIEHLRSPLSFLEETNRLLKPRGFLILEDEVTKAAEGQENVKYVGKVFQDKPNELKSLIKYYRAADFLASPYLYDEGFSTVLLEAVGCGTPLIVPRRGSPKYFLDESVTVFLEHTPTVEEVVSKINFYLKNREELVKLQINCRPFAERNFGEKNAGIILNSYSVS